MGLVEYLGLASGVITVVGFVLKFLWDSRQRKVGRMEARNEGLEAELKKERNRADIESRNADLTPNDLERGL